MNVEQPRIVNRPKRVNAQATRFLSRGSKHIDQRVGNRSLITGTRVKSGEEEHLHVIRCLIAQLLLPRSADQSLRRGSSASRRPLPTRLIDRTVRKIRNPGMKTLVHDRVKYSRAFSSMLPQEGVGICTPKPRKLNAASVRMSPGNVSESETMINGITFGRMC